MQAGLGLPSVIPSEWLLSRAANPVDREFGDSTVRLIGEIPSRRAPKSSPENHHAIGSRLPRDGNQSSRGRSNRPEDSRDRGLARSELMACVLLQMRVRSDRFMACDKILGFLDCWSVERPVAAVC